MDTTKINGQRISLAVATIWNSFEDVTQIRVCYFHSVELFLLGEKRFFAAYPELAADIRVKKSKYTDISSAREA